MKVFCVVIHSRTWKFDLGKGNRVMRKTSFPLFLSLPVSIDLPFSERERERPRTLFPPCGSSSSSPLKSFSVSSFFLSVFGNRVIESSSERRLTDCAFHASFPFPFSRRLYSSMLRVPYTYTYTGTPVMTVLTFSPSSSLYFTPGTVRVFDGGCGEASLSRSLVGWW